MILITGTTGGIGGAVAQAARSAGYTVLDFNRKDFESLASPSASRPSPFALHPSPSLDAVVFCSGVCPVAPLAKTTDDLLAEAVRVNCGLFLSLMRHIVANRLYNPDGMKAIAVSSVSATEGWAGGAAYCASKGALSAMCRALDAELKPRRISVTALEPRHVRTRMFDQCAGRMGVPASAALAPDSFAREILSLLPPAGRL